MLTRKVIFKTKYMLLHIGNMIDYVTNCSRNDFILILLIENTDLFKKNSDNTFI